MLLPALGKARSKAKNIGCINNLKQIGMAGEFYCGEYDDQFPLSVTNGANTKYFGAQPPSWCNLFEDYFSGNKVYRCPEGPNYLSPVKQFLELKKSSTPQKKVYYPVVYGMNAWLSCYGSGYEASPRSRGKCGKPGSTPFFLDCNGNSEMTYGAFDKFKNVTDYSSGAYLKNYNAWNAYFGAWHSQSGNIVYVDGHASSMGYLQALKIANGSSSFAFFTKGNLP